MKRLISFLLCFALVFSLCHLTESEAADYRKIKIAVMDFQQNGTFDSADVGKIVAEWLTTSLVETGRFDVIERRLLQQLIEEQKIGKSGLVDPGSASKLGRLLGVKTIVSGTVQSYGGIYEINARLINVETGSIITAEKVSAVSTTRLSDLVSRISTKIMQHFPLQGYVVQRNGNKVIIDLGLHSGVRPDMLFSVYTEGAPIKHPKTREILSVERNIRGTIKIIDVKDNTSTCIITKEQGRQVIKVGQLITGILAEDEDTIMATSDPLPPPEPKPVRSRKRPQQIEEPAVNTPEPLSAPVTIEAGRSISLQGHTNDVKSLAFSPNGTMAASGDGDHNILLWDTTSWRQTGTLKGHEGDVQALQFSQDGRILASGSRDEKIILWNVHRQEQMFISNVKDRVNSVDFSPNGTYLATGANSKNIILWDIRNGSQVRVITGNNSIQSLDFSPNGRYLATAGSSKTIDLWDTQNAKHIRSFVGHDRDVRAVAFSPGGKILASGGNDKKLILWDVKSGRQIKTLSGHDNDIVCLAISRDGHRMISAQTQRSGTTILVWDFNSGRQVSRLKVDKKAEAISLSPNGRYLMIGQDKNILVYRLD